MLAFLLLRPFFKVGSRGIIEKLAVLIKARAVTGAVPRVLCPVVFENAPKVRTSGR